MRNIFYIVIVCGLYMCKPASENEPKSDKQNLLKTNTGYVYTKYKGSLYYQFFLDVNKDTLCKLVIDTTTNKIITDEGPTHFKCFFVGGSDKNKDQFLDVEVTSLNIKGLRKSIDIYEILTVPSGDTLVYLAGYNVPNHVRSFRVTFKDKKESRKLKFHLVYEDAKAEEHSAIIYGYSFVQEPKWKIRN